MMEIVCFIIYIILAILLFLRIRVLDGIEQRERQMCVTRRRWLYRRLFYILVSGIACGSLLTGGVEFVFKMQHSLIAIPKTYFWICAVLIIMIFITFYYLMALSGKVILIYFGTMALWIGLSALSPFVFRLPQMFRQPAVCCILLLLAWLVMYVVYRKLFLKKDLSED